MTKVKWRLGLGGLRYLLPLLAILVLALTPTVAMASIYANVTINATPSYIAISNAPDNYTFGTVETSTNYTTTENYFNVTNEGSVNTDISVGTNNTEWVGGTVWSHSDTATPGADTAGLMASTDFYASEHIIVKNASPDDLTTSLAEDASVLWELRLLSPTSFSDGELKAIQIVLTGSAS